MTKPRPHATHPAIIARLKRADGHLRAVIGMIESGKPCLDVAQQLLAVEKAVANAKRTLIHDHMDHCLDADSDPGERDELKAIARFL
ncbi:MAG: metal-sensing transcriptional repressor [Pseudomonadota bacterium]